MIEEAIEIRTSDGTADGILFRAEGERRPGVIHLTDIGGIRPSHREMAKRLAEKGYTVLMPNVFYRTTKPPVIDIKIGMGDPKTMQRFSELRAPLTPEAVERDATAYVNFLAAHAATSAGSIGVVGYCFTGAFAMRTAAAMPGKVAAMASFHGGGLYTDEPTSPHLVLPRIKAQLYFGHATNDRSMPQEAIEKFDRALAAWGGKYESEVYEGAFHGWTTSDAPVYNEPQAERAFTKLTELFAGTLK
ncbi:dienelactone hydrolase family protein [Candidatus Binatus sp.]|uniref:dienelactone hydrolase family protein n=2 Tax=Candidatus Binatus sp. TaxID=2811406 RepID=UPI003CC63DF9